MAYTKGSGLKVRHIIENAYPCTSVTVIDCDGCVVATERDALDEGYGDYEVMSITTEARAFLVVMVDANE